MRMYDIIKKKRDGFTLTKEEINYVITSYIEEEIPDYQVSAWLMAIFLKGMTSEESGYLTTIMAESGDMIDLSAISGVKVDKHSTGGVGDSVTLGVAPLVASVGVPVAKMSGRGLGHTGGTLDKLESIPNLSVQLTNNEFVSLVNKNKLAVMGQTRNLTPADELIYSLRDVTATVDSIPLIASSIMSKKLAAGADAIVLDVKVGSGAFMKTFKEARELAQTMVDIGTKVGKKTTAIISQMDQPLGYAIGNALEIREIIAMLQGEGPDDLRELCLAVGSQMLVLANRVQSMHEGKKILNEQIENKQALKTFEAFITAQKGNKAIIKNPNILPTAANKVTLPAQKAGYIKSINTAKLGEVAMRLGAGRETKDDQVDLAVGLVLNKKIGDYVQNGEPLLTIHTNKVSAHTVTDALFDCFTFVQDAVAIPKLILDIID